MEEFDYFSPGDRFGDYVIVKLLGKGGMGAVYLAKSPSSANLYAIKVMVPPDGPQRHEWRQRFVQEAEFAMRIRHPNLISVYDVGEDPATEYCYIIMDYVPGGSLSDRIKAQGKLDIRTAIDITIKIASALDVVHKAGIVHRDVKPDNIMFDADGSPKLSDLGIAKVSGRDDDTNVTKTGMLLGTPAYMSPEQMMNSHEVDARADIYSLGMVLYEMLTGRRPNDTSTIVQLLAKAIQGEELPDVRTVRPEVSVAVSYVLSKMVAVKPEARPASAVEVARLLYDAATGKLLVKQVKEMPASPSKNGISRSDVVVASDKKESASGGGAVKWVVAALGVAALCAATFFGARSLNAPKKDGRGPAVVTNTIERIVRDTPVVVTNTIVREMAHVVTNVDIRSDFTASREVPLASAPESLRKDLERLRNIYARRKGNGRLVFGRLMVEDGAVNDVATWTWLNGDGTFTAAAIMAARNGLLFLKHGYEPLCVRVDEAKLPWNGDVAIDVGTVTLRRLPVDKTATFVLTPHLPNGVQSGMLTLNIDNYSPCGDDWGTRGRERMSCRVKSVPFRDGERISIAGCSPARYIFRLEATGCQAFGGDAVNLIQGENDVGERSMLLARTARFAVRKRDERGSEWMRLNINVDGNASLRINGMKDSWNNTYRIGLDGYRADAADSLKASFGFSPNTFEDLGEMAVEEYERRERDGMEISPVSTYDSTMVTFSPGHIYRHRNRHWGCDMLIAFEAYEAPVPPAGAAGNQKGRKNAGRNAELAVEDDVTVFRTRRPRELTHFLAQRRIAEETRASSQSAKPDVKGRALGPSAAGNAMGTVILVPRLDRDPKAWAYSFELQNGWEKPDFDDSKWKRAQGGFGMRIIQTEVVRAKLNTLWDSKRIFLRRHFKWQGGCISRAIVDLFHDDEVTLYLNGKCILNVRDSNSDWMPHDISVDMFSNAIKTGDNVLCAEVENYQRAAFFDCGLLVQGGGERLARLTVPDGVRMVDTPAGRWTVMVKDGVAQIGDGEGPALTPRPKGTLVVPAELDDIKIAKLAARCLAESGELHKVIIPEGIRDIGDLAFLSCERLEEVSIPESLESTGVEIFRNTGLKSFDLKNVRALGRGAFRDCARMEKISVKAGNPTYTVKDGVLYDRCARAIVFCPRSRKSFKIPSGIDAIYDAAFEQTMIKAIEIPESVQLVEYCAFTKCPGLESVVFTGDDCRIDSWALGDNPNLRRVVLPKKLTNLDDWSIFDYDTKLEHIAIPDTVEIVSDAVFAHCNSLKKIAFGKSLRLVKRYAFGECAALEAVSFAVVPEFEGDYILGRCPNLKTVRFLSGDAPQVDPTFYKDSNPDLVTLVPRGSKGWNGPGSTDLPAKWPLNAGADARRIRYIK